MPRRTARIALIPALLAGCAAPVVPVAPDSPHLAGERAVLAADPRVLAGHATASSTPRPARAVTLAQAIDLAQRNNPRTRAAWARARQAANAAQLVETAYMPRLNAHILLASARSESAALRDPLGLAPEGTLALRGDEAAAVLSLQWLLFDFGGRAAARGEAGELSFAANAGFVGVHQKVIHDVTQAWHGLWAATRKEDMQRRKLRDAQAMAAAARARRAQGLATITDVAQVEQVVAQSRFDLARTESETRAASVRLSSAAGLPATQPLRPAFPDRVQMPARVPARIDALMEEALARRPDLQAAFARARVADHHVAAVEAQFRPKIIAAANLGQSLTRLGADDSRLPGEVARESRNPVASVFVGVTIPLWDGGAKALRLDSARAQQVAAQADAERLRSIAEAEIVTAYELLKSSLAANAAAAELVGTTRTTYDAARAFADQGLATTSEVNVALRLLYDAELSRIEAQHAAFSAAATLAFASGQLISPR